MLLIRHSCTSYVIVLSVFKTIVKFFTSRKATISVEFEKTLADTIADKYENSKVMVHIIRNWRDDAEFARQVTYLWTPVTASSYRRPHDAHYGRMVFNS